MKSNKSCLFTINVGSSGIKFSMYKSDDVLIPSFYGAIENIDTKNTIFSFTDNISNEKNAIPVKVNDHERAFSSMGFHGLSYTYLLQQLKDKLIEHKHYVNEHGKDMPEILNWKWTKHA